MIGNDVVDLRDPETRSRAIHPGFDARVFGAVELERVRGAARPELERWRLWAAKEAAFKAAKRSASALVFAPSRFRVESDDERAGRVTIGDRSFHVCWDDVDDAVHAVASEDGVSDGRLIHGACRVHGDDPSHTARRLAIETMAAALEVDPQALRIETIGRVPTLHLSGERPMPLSLSHHGEMVAFAARGGAR